MQPRLIRMKYAGVCRACGSPLAVGSPGYWRQGHGAACLDCGRDAFSQPRRHHSTTTSSRAPAYRAPSRLPNSTAARPTAVAKAAAASTSDDQRLWSSYCDYLLACVEIEARDNKATLESGQGWSLLDSNPVADPHLKVAAAADIVSAARAGESSLRIGWPVLVQVEESGEHALLPLLTLDVDVSSGPAPHFVPSEARPSLNPRLREYMDASDVAELEAIARENSDLAPFDVAGLLLDSLGESRDLIQGALGPPEAEPGAYNCVILESLSSTHFTVALRRELEQLRSRTDWRGTAAAALIGQLPHTTRKSDAELVASPIPLNDSQIDAVVACREPITVITGPPGTGKSQVVTALAATAWIDRESFLITSTNNAAVDVASSRIQALDPILVLRSGNQEHRQRLSETCGDLLKTPGGPGPSKADRKALEVAYRELEALRSQSHHRSQLQISLLEAHIELEKASDNVLFADSQPESAAESDVRRIARLTRREKPGWWARRRLAKVAARLGIRVSAGAPALHLWASSWLKVTELTQQLKSLGPLATPQDVSRIENSWIAASTQVLRECAALARQNGKSALRSLTDQRAGQGRRPLATPTDLQHLRGWAVTALSVARTLPLQAGVVDVLILDEASQCSLAHALPLAYRCKRAGVLGDPQQLKPVVRISEAQESRAASESGVETSWLANLRLSFRENSAFDAFERSSGQVHLLNEHYRCHPSISGWFNREFYSGSLTVLTPVDPLERRGIETTSVEGTSDRGPTGSWVNEAEAEAVADLAGDLAEHGSSLGVVTPYRAQARRIQAALSQRYGAEWMDKHDVAVATAHRFQGSERDVILFSSVLTPESPPRSARWLEEQRHLINVGASRARRLLVVVGHPNAASAHQLPTLGSLWASASTTSSGPPNESSLSESELRFWRAFDSGLGDITPRQRVEGYDIDFAWMSPWGMPVAIEVDDDSSDAPPRSRRRDIERDAALNRVGWQVVRVPGWYCYSHPDAVIDSLRDTLTALQDPTSSTVELMPWVGR